MNEEEMKALEAVKAAVKTGVDGVKADFDVKAKELESKSDELNKKQEQLEADSKKLQEQLDELDIKTQGVHAAGTDKVQEQLKGFSKETHKGKVSQTIELKEAGVSMMRNNVNASNGVHILSTEVEAGINHAPAADLVILNYVDTRPTNAAKIVWINKVNEKGNAQWVPEGGLKPLRSFEFKEENASPNKIAVRFNVSEEALEDIDFLTAEIKTDGLEEVDRETAKALFNGDGTGDKPKGIISYAGKFALTNVKGEDPDNYGAIRAAITQIKMLGYTPNAVFINPIDAANMDLKKGSNGQYVLPPFSTSNGKNISGVAVVETAEVPAGKILVGDFKKFKVRPYKDKTLRTGYNGEDFAHNMVTMIVEQRLFAYVNSLFQGAFIYDDLATIKAAIKAGA